MISRTLFLLGMFVVIMYLGFLMTLFNAKKREAGATTASKWNSVIAIASGALLFLGALIAHTLGR